MQPKDITHLSKDIRSMNVLASLINGYPFIPYTDSAIDFHSLHILINDIVINNRKSILEFGSGISTLLIGRLFKANNIQSKLYSIDDNEGWYHAMCKKIKDENLEEYIELIYAPLQPHKLCHQYDHTLDWYSTEILNQLLDNIKIDMLIVDGPMAYKEDIKRSRFPALFYVKDRLCEDYSIFLHDTNRDGEKSIIRDWTEVIGFESIQYTEKLTGFIFGKQYTITI